MFNYKAAAAALLNLVKKYEKRATPKGQLNWGHAQLLSIVEFNIKYEHSEGLALEEARATVWRDVYDGFLQDGSGVMNAAAVDLFNSLPSSLGEKMYNEAVEAFQAAMDEDEEEEREEEDERFATQAQKRLAALDKADEAKAKKRKQRGLTLIEGGE